MFLKKLITLLIISTSLPYTDALTCGEIIHHQPAQKISLTRFQRAKACIKCLFWGSAALVDCMALSLCFIMAQRYIHSAGILDALNTEQSMPLNLYDREKQSGTITYAETEVLRKLRNLVKHRDEIIWKKHRGSFFFSFMSIVTGYSLYICARNMQDAAQQAAS
jgi:hypothetical protein